MVFCNTYQEETLLKNIRSHNPYFNRWFSAIRFIKFLKAYNG